MKITTPVIVYRTINIEGRAEEGEAQDRSVDMLLATETPCSRGYFDEVLKCNPEACDMSFMGSGRAPLCVDHNLRQQVGVFDEAVIEGNELRAKARLSRSADGQKELDDIRDGIRRNVSVGYMILDAEYIPAPTEYQRDMLIVTKWRPMEGSLCAIGLDEASGIGRSNEKNFPQALADELRQRSEAEKVARAAQPTSAEPVPADVPVEPAATPASEPAQPTSESERSVAPVENESPVEAQAPAANEVARDEVVAETPTAPEMAPAAAASAEPTETRASETERTVTEELPASKPDTRPSVVEIRIMNEELLKLERERAAGITALGAQYELVNEATAANAAGRSVAEFQSDVLKKIASRQRETAMPIVDLDNADLSRYSVGRAIEMAVTRALNPHAAADGLEREVSNALIKQGHKQADGRSIVVPWSMFGRATSIAGSGGTAQHLVPQQHREMLPHLVAQLALVRAGVTVLSGLAPGDIDFPSGLAGVASSNAQTPDETGTTTDAEVTFRNVRASSKPVRTLATYSRTLFLNSMPSIQAVIERALRQRLERKLEQQMLSGTGNSGQLLGIDATSSIGNGDFVSNAVSYGSFLNMLTVLDNAKALMGPTSFVTTFGVIAKALNTYRDSGSGIPVIRAVQGLIDEWEMDGARVLRSHEVKSTFASPTSASQLIAHGCYAGDFSESFLCLWGGGVEIMVDPYTAAATDSIKIYASVNADFVIPRPETIAKADNILL
jgi:HK97 family phage major capsid protein